MCFRVSSSLFLWYYVDRKLHNHEVQLEVKLHVQNVNKQREPSLLQKSVETKLEQTGSVLGGSHNESLMFLIHWKNDSTSSCDPFSSESLIDLVDYKSS